MVWGIKCDCYLRLELVNSGLIRGLKSVLVIADVEECIAPGLQVLPREEKRAGKYRSQCHAVARRPNEVS